MDLRIDPWGTPEETLKISKVYFLTDTCCNLLYRLEAIKFIKWLEKLQDGRSPRKILWLILANTREICENDIDLTSLKQNSTEILNVCTKIVNIAEILKQNYVFAHNLYALSPKFSGKKSRWNEENVLSNSLGF